MIHAKTFSGAIVALGVLTTFDAAGAATVIKQAGKQDPTTNGFTVVTCCGSGATGAGKNDKGTPVWAMGGGDSGDQFAYQRAPTATQSQTIAKKGFVLTVIERVIEASAPTYTPDSPIVVGEALLDDGTVRWEIDVGLNAAGDPVVVLPNSLDNDGPGSTIQSHGASYVLTGAGSSYNKYQLVVKSGKATLYVNGNQVLTGYTGNTSFVSGDGVVFAVGSGGQMNYNLVELTSTPKLP